MLLKARHSEWELTGKVLLMGVINVTPDSFSDGGECLQPEKARARALEFEKAGADLLDIGAESSRPGAAELSADEEWKRLEPVLQKLSSQSRLPISVDTTKALVARWACEMGASFINDISALKDPEMARTIAEFHAGVVLMHRRGNSATMQSMAHYQNLIPEVMKELRESVDRALEAGISYEQIVIDPGIGFAKTREHNLSLLKHLEVFKKFERPLLIGTSRKSFLGEITGKPARQRVFATAATVALAVERGAKIVRVHDVDEIKDVVRVTQAILSAQ